MKILFVCLGNICRSPTAEGVFRQYVEQAGLSDKVTIDSAGTADWHIGKSPDPRTQSAAAQRGYDLSGLRGRQVQAEDFHTFDLILAMDKSNFSHLQSIQPAESKAELALYLPRFGISPDEVPDPYYGGEDGFELVLDMLEQASQVLLDEVKAHV
ncbi:low molecular weight protein-tyrosine-phosphatase [Denitrificimonas sp. JX-1]|uniref:protein-tyrosine-phosphatase n=1 Tax=Denitrificimonas halotolerans TaxID=3098930 RepID=A0ABU5GNE7_9GAMM|nr:low molecular weight protein-tyrosine-phosphatase [Denitrificimonas sp. JX-1]MDY7217997.1 low molecular weight protein-tyrosine-phosphatase [Denitrificimonas sp. JX-1]